MSALQQHPSLTELVQINEIPGLSTMLRYMSQILNTHNYNILPETVINEAILTAFQANSGAPVDPRHVRPTSKF